MGVKYVVGDKVYFTKTFRHVYWWMYSKTPPKPLKYPHEKKITQVTYAKDGTVLYQVKGGRFTESWIGDMVFDTKEEAEVAIKNEKLKNLH